MVETYLFWFSKEDSPSWISYGHVKVFGCIDKSSVRVSLSLRNSI